MTDATRISALVIDDNVHMRSILMSLLHAVGVQETRQASDGTEAMKILMAWQPTFLVLDQNMQPMNGTAFAKKLRLSQATFCSEIPIIMLTAHTERAMVETARDAGIDEILAKPISTKALLQRLNAIMNDRRPFVRAGKYAGPDRRRHKTDNGYAGPKRRIDDRDEDTFDLD